MSNTLSRLGWDETVASAYRSFDRPDAFPGRVLRADRGICTVLTGPTGPGGLTGPNPLAGPSALADPHEGPVRATLGGGVLVAGARDAADLPCAGDWVVLRRWPDRRITVECVLPRRTALIRRTAGKEAGGQVLAANMDTVAVVEPMHPAPVDGRVERLLALAWESGADPVVLLTKADTARDPAAIARQISRLAPGIPVVPVSVRGGPGVEQVRAYAGSGRTLALLGRSGAGKSSLVNALAGSPVMPVQQIRDADGKGRHTTAYRNLVLLPRGGAVLDTPGIRGVGLLETAEGLDRAFADLTALAQRCRFGDCRHESEPDCAVTAALADGSLTARRLASWRKLQHEVEVESARRRVRLAEATGRRRRRP